MTTGRPRHQGIEERRQALLDAAVGALAVDPGSSLALIAAAAECSKPLIYEVFSSRDALVDAVIERETEWFRGELGAARAMAAALPPRAAVRCRVAALFSYCRAHPSGARLLLRLALDGDPHGRERFAAIRREVIDVLTSEIGSVPGLLVLGALRTLADAIPERDPATDDETIDAVTAFIIGGIVELRSSAVHEEQER
jgi:AcrR family transcriptional regulator